MRKRELIEQDGAKREILLLEVLLDIRELLKVPATPKKPISKIKKEV